MDGSPQRGLLQRNHPMALRCRRVGAVHSIKSWHQAANVWCPLFLQQQTSSARPVTSEKCYPRTHSKGHNRALKPWMYWQGSAAAWLACCRTVGSLGPLTRPVRLFCYGLSQTPVQRELPPGRIWSRRWRAFSFEPSTLRMLWSLLPYAMWSLIQVTHPADFP